jgi:di/tricarboxylate transporter
MLIGTPYIILENPLVNLLVVTIFTILIYFSSNVISNIAYSIVLYFIVFNLAPKLIRLRKFIP